LPSSPCSHSIIDGTGKVRGVGLGCEVGGDVGEEVGVVVGFEDVVVRDAIVGELSEEGSQNVQWALVDLGVACLVDRSVGVDDINVDAVEGDPKSGGVNDPAILKEVVVELTKGLIVVVLPQVLELLDGHLGVALVDGGLEAEAGAAPVADPVANFVDLVLPVGSIQREDTLLLEQVKEVVVVLNVVGDTELREALTELVAVAGVV